jgi:signal transduction histidine kinase/HAMP domain-containing protein
MELGETAPPKRAPAVGMRGGLGRTLLTAFLVLAILPLSVVSWYASTRSRHNIQEEITSKLISITALKEAQISRWADRQTARLEDLASYERISAAIENLKAEDEAAAIEMLATATANRGFPALAILNAQGQIRVASDSAVERRLFPLPQSNETVETVFSSTDRNPGGEIVLVRALEGMNTPSTHYLAAWIDPEGLLDILNETVGLGETGEVYLIASNGIGIPSGRSVEGHARGANPDDAESQRLYENYDGVPVIGIQRQLPDLGVTLVVEQAQEEAFAGNDTVVTAVIMADLIVALGAAIIAAFVTRQITKPIVQLTESALSVASGDLSQRVQITSRDEIGILSYVFNRMTAELESLYNDLEDKVAQRTRSLQQANYMIQRRAIQMQASAEVGQAITSILNPDRLLDEVVHLIRDRFVYSYTAVYTLNENGEQGPLTLRAAAGEDGSAAHQKIAIDAQNPIGRAFRSGEPVVESGLHPAPVGPPAEYTRVEAALPLRMGERSIGVLTVESTEPEGFDADEVSVLQNLASQVTVALENARAYEIEREAAQRLREMDQFKRRFLTNMSHELRTPLTNILGFSRLMMKGLEGPLTAQQQEDVEIIYHNGQHLLGLINDLLDISQIEAGLMTLQFKDVNIAELVHSVMATTSALVRDKEIDLIEEVEPDLPRVKADPTRIRQVLLHLLANAAKFTKRGQIAVRAWAENGTVRVSVSDTGAGIRERDQQRIFKQFEQGLMEEGHRPEGAGLGLALCKEFLEMHGGRIWVESEVNRGSTFTFELPTQPQEPKGVSR